MKIYLQDVPAGHPSHVGTTVVYIWHYFFRLKSATAGILDTLFYHIIIFDIKIINNDNQNRNDAIIMTRDKDFNLLTFCDCIDYVQT